MPPKSMSIRRAKPPRAPRQGKTKASTLRTPLRNATPALPALCADVRTLWVMRNVGAHYLMWWGMLLGTLLEALFPPTNSQSIRQRYQLSFLPARMQPTSRAPGLHSRKSRTTHPYNRGLRRVSSGGRSSPADYETPASWYYSGIAARQAA